MIPVQEDMDSQNEFFFFFFFFLNIFSKFGLLSSPWRIFYAVLNVLSRFAIILMGKRELVALLRSSS